MTAIPSTTDTAQSLIYALGLPEGCQVDQRVPKKLLLENSGPTAADKRLITDAIEEIQWIAALKPNSIGVPVYRDALREYLEIAVLVVILRGVVKPASRLRLAELVHRGVPYPALLLLIEGQVLTLSLAHKRWAQNEADKVVLDGSLVWASLPETRTKDSLLCDPDAYTEAVSFFMQSLSVTRQPKATLHALYQGWMDSVLTLRAAQLTGSYRAPTIPEQAAARRRALADCEQLDANISRLRAQGVKEKQIARQVSINLEIKALLIERKRAERHL